MDSTGVRLVHWAQTLRWKTSYTCLSQQVCSDIDLQYKWTNTIMLHCCDNHGLIYAINVKVVTIIKFKFGIRAKAPPPSLLCWQDSERTQGHWQLEVMRNPRYATEAFALGTFIISFFNALSNTNDPGQHVAAVATLVHWVNQVTASTQSLLTCVNWC